MASNRGSSATSTRPAVTPRDVGVGDLPDGSLVIAGAAGDRLAAHLFFLFFVAQILSPSFFGVTIYLEVLVIALTAGFWRWVTTLVIPGMTV